MPCPLLSAQVLPTLPGLRRLSLVHCKDLVHLREVLKVRLTWDMWCVRMCKGAHLREVLEVRLGVELPGALAPYQATRCAVMCPYPARTSPPAYFKQLGSAAFFCSVICDHTYR